MENIGNLNSAASEEAKTVAAVAQDLNTTKCTSEETGFSPGLAERYVYQICIMSPYNSIQSDTCILYKINH